MPRQHRRTQKSNRVLRTAFTILLGFTVAYHAAGFSSHLNWLERNIGSEGDFERLQAAVDEAPNLHLAQDVLEKFAGRLQRSRDRAQAFQLRAALAELRGAEEAERFYRTAFEHSADATDALLAAGRLALERGSYHQAAADAEQVARRAAERGERDAHESAVLLRARADAGLDSYRQAFDRLQEFGSRHSLKHPATLLYKAELALRLGEHERYARLVQRIAADYPDSPELRLARKRSGRKDPWVALRPSPAAVFGGAFDPPEAIGSLDLDSGLPVPGAAREHLQAEQRVIGVQTGSFSEKDNAEYMARDLRAEGFTNTEIRRKQVGNSTYYQVFVRVDQARSGRSEAQQIVVELKESGFEGFLLFERAR